MQRDQRRKIESPQGKAWYQALIDRNCPIMLGVLWGPFPAHWSGAGDLSCMKARPGCKQPLDMTWQGTPQKDKNPPKIQKKARTACDAQVIKRQPPQWGRFLMRKAIAMKCR